MNLIVDIGNTRIKAAIYENDNIINHGNFANPTADNFKSLIYQAEADLNTDKRVTNAIISSVAEYPKEILEFLQLRYRLIILSSKTPIPIASRYITKETLGNDRIALVVAAAEMFPTNHKLIIDAGSCVTYDFINKTNEYLGGGISPGIMMRFKALNTFTDKLPLIDQIRKTELIGNSTLLSISSGVLNGILAEVDGVIDEYKRRYPDIKILFTGGDLKFFEENLKNDIFADSNLLTKGLNKILMFNLVVS
jgi:type III pantothenate kinase